MTTEPKTPLRVVALLENNPYPTDVAVNPHMEALAKAGHQVVVIAPRDKDQAAHEVIRGVEVYRIPVPTPQPTALNYALEFVWATIVISAMTIWVWMRHGMDVLHVYNPPDTLFVCAILPKLAGKVIVYHVRDLAPELYLGKFDRSGSIVYRALVLFEQIMCRLADYIIVVNGSYRDRIMQRNKVRPEQITIVRQAPDIERIKPAPPVPELRARASKIIAYLGSMAKQDGVEHLLESLYSLDHDLGYHDWLCLLIGPSDHPRAIEAMSEKLGIRDRVQLTGFLPYTEWVPLLSTADVCVEPAPSSPINDISTMQKLMDYMSLCRPSVAYDMKEHHITAGDAALYATPNDPACLARDILRLIQDPELGRQMGQIGRERMERSLAWTFQRQQLLKLYGSIGQSASAEKQ